MGRRRTAAQRQRQRQQCGRRWMMLMLMLMLMLLRHAGGRWRVWLAALGVAHCGAPGLGRRGPWRRLICAARAPAAVWERISQIWGVPVVDGGRLPISRREMSEVKMSAPCSESAENTNAGWCGGASTRWRVSLSSLSPGGDSIFCRTNGSAGYSHSVLIDTGIVYYTVRITQHRPVTATTPRHTSGTKAQDSPY